MVRALADNHHLIATAARPQPSAKRQLAGAARIDARRVDRGAAGFGKSIEQFVRQPLIVG